MRKIVFVLYASLCGAVLYSMDDSSLPSDKANLIPDSLIQNASSNIKTHLTRFLDDKQKNSSLFVQKKIECLSYHKSSQERLQETVLNALLHDTEIKDDDLQQCVDLISETILTFATYGLEYQKKILEEPLEDSVDIMNWSLVDTPHFYLNQQKDPCKKQRQQNGFTKLILTPTQILKDRVSESQTKSPMIVGPTSCVLYYIERLRQGETDDSLYSEGSPRRLVDIATYLYQEESEKSNKDYNSEIMK